MSNYGLTHIPSPGGLSSSFEAGNWLSAILGSITRFVHAGKWIEAQREITLAALKARAAERRYLIDALREIALATKDDKIREQMFREIMFLAMQSS